MRHIKRLKCQNEFISDNLYRNISYLITFNASDFPWSIYLFLYFLLRVFFSNSRNWVVRVNRRRTYSTFSPLTSGPLYLHNCESLCVSMYANARQQWTKTLTSSLFSALKSAEKRHCFFKISLAVIRDFVHCWVNRKRVEDWYTGAAD